MLHQPAAAANHSILIADSRMITVTERAAQFLKKHLEIRKKINKLEKTPGQAGFKFGIQAGGCHGFKYIFQDTLQPDKYDKVFESNGIKIYVDPKSLKFVDETEIDHTGNILQLMDGIIFKNPKAQSSCGCGTSVEFKPDVFEKK